MHKKLDVCQSLDMESCHCIRVWHCEHYQKINNGLSPPPGESIEKRRDVDVSLSEKLLHNKIIILFNWQVYSLFNLLYKLVPSRLYIVQDVTCVIMCNVSVIIKLVDDNGGF